MAMQKGKVRVDDKVLRLTELGVLLAIIIIMAFVPMVGYIKIGVVEITLITVPVIVGAMVLNPSAGAILGFAFGLTSFLTGVFGTSAFGVALLEINPLLFFIMCVPTRTLMGWLTGLFFKAMKKLMKKESIIAYSLTGLVGSLLNTPFFMSALILCFWKTEFIQGIAESFGVTNVFAFAVALVGINGLIEAVCCTILSAVICKALNLWFKS